MSRHDIPQRTQTLNESHTSQIIALIPSLLSPNNETRKHAENALKALSLANNYLCCLLQIITQEHLEFNLRQFCAIDFKNGIERFWRKHSPHAIQAQERQILRSQLLNALMHIHTESIFELMSFNVARIARVDCPGEWNNLIDDIVELIRDSDENARLKAVVLLKDIVKQLATKKFLDSKSYFRDLSQKLLPFVAQIWEFFMVRDYKLLQDYVSQPSNPETVKNFHQQLMANFKGTEASISIIAHLIDHGFKALNDEAMTVLHRLLEHTQKLYQFFEECKKRDIRNAITNIVVHCIRKFLRPIIAIIPRHPLGFTPLLESYIQFALTLMSQNMPHEANAGFIEPKYDQMLVRCMTLLQIILTTPAYSSTNLNTSSTTAPSPKQIVHEKCFTLQTVGNLVNMLITKFMKLSREDLEVYDDNPEEFLKDQDSDWDGTLKSTAETLFMTVMDTYEASFGQEMTTLLQHLFSMTQDPNTNMSPQERLLLREATYCALGWGCYYFNNFIDSDELFSSQLRPEALNPITDRLIRRRIVWVLGRWVEKMSAETRIATYTLFQQILQTDRVDLVTQLSIFNALSEMVDDFDFDPEGFAPFTDYFTKHIFRILAYGHIEDSKLKLLHFLTGLVCKLKQHNTQDVAAIILQLSVLWRSSQSYLIQTAVVSLMQELVNNAPNEIWMRPEQMQFIAHLIRCGIDPDQQGSVYYCEEALELYRSVLVQCEMHAVKDANTAQAVSDILLPLVQYLFSALERSSEYILKALPIISNHICLNAEKFLSKYAQQMAQLTFEIIGNFKPTALHQMSICLDVIMSRYPEQSVVLFRSSLQKMLENLVEKKEEDLVVAHYAILECRVILQDKNAFLQWIQEMALKGGAASPEIVLKQFILIASEAVDHIWITHHRKIVALALLSLYPTQSNELLSVFVSHLIPALSTMHMDCSMTPPESEGELDDNLPLSAQDEKISKINISQAVQHALQTMRSSFGEENYRQLISSVNAEALENLGIK